MEKTELPIEDNLIVKLNFKFSVNTIIFIDSQHWGNKLSICNQLLKSATSIGANIRETQNSESKNHFIHKFKIAAKESEETEYWLLLLNEVGMNTKPLLIELTSIRKVISKIISSTKKLIDKPN
jgi:hypothetical protein